MKKTKVNTFTEILKKREMMIKKEQIKGDVLKKIGALFATEVQAQKKAMEFKDNGFEYRENILAHINQIKERLMFEAQGRGINKEHMQKFMDEKCSPDFELANVVQRMIDEKIVSPENGYPNP